MPTPIEDGVGLSKEKRDMGMVLVRILSRLRQPMHRCLRVSPVQYLKSAFLQPSPLITLDIRYGAVEDTLFHSTHTCEPGVES